RALSGAFGQLRLRDTAGIQARAADADLRAVLRRVPQHQLYVVVARRYLLVSLRAGRSVADQKDLHFLAGPLGESACKPERVVAALGSVGSIVENEQCFSHDYTPSACAVC